MSHKTGLEYGGGKRNRSLTIQPTLLPPLAANKSEAKLTRLQSKGSSNVDFSGKGDNAVVSDQVTPIL